MTTYNTGNPIGSIDARDRLDNSENMDILENSTTLNAHPDRLGTMRKTRKGMELEHDNQIAAHESEHDAQISAHEAEHDNQMQSFENDFDNRLAGMAFTRVGTFTTGATLTDMRQVLVWEVSQGGNGCEYGWSGTFPKVVTAGLDPSITPGFIMRSDSILRAELSALNGAHLVGNSAFYVEDIRAVDATLIPDKALVISRTNNGVVAGCAFDYLKNSTASVSGDIIAPTTGTGRLVRRVLDISDVRWYGAVGDGVTNDTEAVISALAQGRRVVIPYGCTVKIAPSSPITGALVIDGTLLISATATLNADITVSSTGKINVSTGAIATFGGEFSAPIRKIFTGSGTIYGIHETWPEWWGAAYRVDSAAALEAAFNCIKGAGGANYKRGVLHVNALGITRQVTLTMSTFVHIDIVGGGNNLIGGEIALLSGFSGYIGVLVQGDSTNNIASFSINQIALRNISGSTVTVGWQFDNLSGVTQNSVTHTTAHGFGYNFEVVNSRLIDFDNCAGWSGSAANCNGILFTTSGAVAGTFVGDCKITKCQFETAGPGSSIIVTVSNSGHQCKGLHIDATALYKSDTGSQFSASATNGGIIGDIFFSESCQFDGFTNRFFSLAADGAGSIIDDIIFNGTYFRGSSAANAMNVVATNSGQISTVRLLGCYIANAVAPVANFSAGYGLVFSGCNFYDTTGSTTTAIVFASCNRFVCSDNIVSRSGGGYFATFIGISGASDYYTVTNNIAGGIVSTSVVSDGGHGTHKTITGNI